MKTTLIATALLTFPPVTLAELAWSIDSGVGHTDNATLSATDEISDTLPWVGGLISYQQDTRRVQASLDAQGNYVHYVDGTYDDDFLGYATGKLQLGIVPETFLWTAEDTFGQVTIDQFDPATPDNRQNVNTFTTGPDFLVRLAAQSQLRLSGRFSDARYENSDEIDTQTSLASISFERNVSAKTSWAIVASGSRIEYDAPGAEAYDQSALYGSWRSVGARQTLSIDMGANRVEGFDDTFIKPLLRANWQRKIAPSWTMDLNAASEYRNTSEQFVERIGENTPTVGTSDVPITDVPAATYVGGVSLEFERPRTRFNVGGGYTKLEYVIDNGLDEDYWFATAALSRKFTPRLQGSVTYRLYEKKYDSDGRVDTEQLAELGLDWRAGRSLFLTVGYVYSDSESDSATNTYTSNLVYLTISYRQGGTNAPRGPHD